MDNTKPVLVVIVFAVLMIMSIAALINRDRHKVKPVADLTYADEYVANGGELQLKIALQNGYVAGMITNATETKQYNRVHIIFDLFDKNGRKFDQTDTNIYNLMPCSSVDFDTKAVDNKTRAYQCKVVAY